MKCTAVLSMLAVLSALAMSPTGALAGDLDPPAALSPTMKSLDSIPGSWDRTLPADDGPVLGGPPVPCNSSRFKCVMGAAAVLDRETGLVWERSPGGFDLADPLRWQLAVRGCSLLFKGGRWGWRLPTLQELLSLAVGDPPSLPTGHPFSVSGAYWVATSIALDFAWIFAPGGQGPGGLAVYTDGKEAVVAKAWCVRGGSGLDTQ